MSFFFHHKEKNVRNKMYYAPCLAANARQFHVVLNENYVLFSSGDGGCTKIEETRVPTSSLIVANTMQPHERLEKSRKGERKKKDPQLSSLTVHNVEWIPKRCALNTTNEI